FFHERRQSRMSLTNRVEVPPEVAGTIDVSRIFLPFLRSAQSAIHLVQDRPTVVLGLRSNVVVQRFGQYKREERVASDVVVRRCDDAKGCDNIGDDRVVGDRATS